MRHAPARHDARWRHDAGWRHAPGSLRRFWPAGLTPTAIAVCTLRGTHAPIIIEKLLAILHKVIREEGLLAILVEQNTQKILGVTDRAIIIERGSSVHEGDSVELKVNRAAGISCGCDQRG